ncbi:MAG: hypothetical protein U0457_07020 [Candidatus Sericytochromatia bacterium]
MNIKLKNKKTLFNKLILSFLLTFSLAFNSYATDSDYNFNDKPMTKEEISVWKYKMEKISIFNNHGKWEIIQGINTKLGDIQLLRLVGAENIATERLKSIEFKQNLGNGISLVGLLGAVLSGIILSNVIKVENGFYYGVGGLSASTGIILLGNYISPVIAEEDSHIITLDEAVYAANAYNKKLKEMLNIPESMQ